MVSSFGVEAPILRYGLRSHANPGRRNDRFWFCWPAWAFQVVAPSNPRRQINVIQSTVLALLRSSRLTATEIAERLGIDRELAAFVVIELQGQGYVQEGADWVVTKRGHQLLRGEEEASAELEAGWVFQDPWSKDLWPFIAPALEQAPTTHDGKYRRLNLGSTGSPWDQRIWVQDTSEGYRSPIAEEILRASRRHERFKRRSERRKRQHEDWSDDELDMPAPAGLDMRRITTIQDEPEPVFLTSYLYVPQDTNEMDVDWHACDFFGQGSNPTLRRYLSRRAAEFKPLSDALSTWMGNTCYFDDFEAYQKHTDKIRKQARGLLLRCMSIQVEQCPEAERLQEVFEMLCEVAHLGEDANTSRREHVLLGCRKTLERAFREMAEEYPLNGVSKEMSYDSDVNSALIERVANELGLDPIPDSFKRAKKGQVRAVSDYDDAWRLRPLIVATMLAARQEPQHPLHRVAAQSPDLLSTLDDITSAAGSAAHDNDNPPLTFEALRDTVDDLARLLCLFHDISHSPLQEVFHG